MKIYTMFIASILVALLLCSLSARSQAEPNYNSLSLQYDEGEKSTVVSAKEKLIDATTGLGAAYTFPGRTIHQMPKTVDLSFYGYHDTLQWQGTKTLTLSYNGHTFTNKVFHSLYGEDRDKSRDLVEGKYLESVLVQLPIDVAEQVFKSSSVILTSSPDGFSFQLSNEQMDRCRDLMDTLPTKAHLQVSVHEPNMIDIAGSKDGLPITREITESTSDATLTMPLVALTPRFGISSFAFVTKSGRKAHQPTEALLIAELVDAPLIETEKEVTLNYGDTNLVLTSNTVQTKVMQTGIKFSTRTYLIAYNRFLAMSGSKNLSFTVQGTVVPIPYQKMVGIREIARRIQHK